MNFLDLCSGIGGFRLGLERAGMKCVGFCEIDKYARKSYEAMYDTEGEWRADDITKVTDEEIEGLKRRQVDIIVGGFPCQAFSIAGKRKGFSDTRGTVFFEILRFIKIIRPKYFICENVKGLLSHDGGRTFGTILSSLAELGYSIEWQVLNSKNFGVPQNRERVFIIGHLGEDSGRKVFPFICPGGENPCKLQELTHNVSMGRRVYNPYGISKTLASLGDGWGAKTGLYTVKCGIDLTTNKPKKTQIARCLVARYNKGITNRPAETTGILEGVRIRKLTPRECWRLQGFPDELFDKVQAAGMSDSQLYKQAGNAVTVNVAEAIGKELVKG